MKLNSACSTSELELNKNEMNSSFRRVDSEPFANGHVSFTSLGAAKKWRLPGWFNSICNSCFQGGRFPPPEPTQCWASSGPNLLARRPNGPKWPNSMISRLKTELLSSLLLPEEDNGVSASSTVLSPRLVLSIPLPLPRPLSPSQVLYSLTFSSSPFTASASQLSPPSAT
ncbi:hypothetical protein CRG98_029982, partial [Punica granatum]